MPLTSPNQNEIPREAMAGEMMGNRCRREQNLAVSPTVSLYAGERICNDRNIMRPRIGNMGIKKQRSESRNGVSSGSKMRCFDAGKTAGPEQHEEAATVVARDRRAGYASESETTQL